MLFDVENQRTDGALITINQSGSHSISHHGQTCSKTRSTSVCVCVYLAGDALILVFYYTSESSAGIVFQTQNRGLCWVL